MLDKEMNDYWLKGNYKEKCTEDLDKELDEYKKQA